jgi:hypothetical protein
LSEAWKRCSSCKRDIAYGAVYHVCNVSTCNQKRTALVFCSPECWDAHLGFVNHRESWAVEKRAPSREAAAAEESAQRASLPQSRESRPAATPRPAAPAGATVVRRAGSSSVTPSAPSEGANEEGMETDVPKEILIVASKLKAYIKARSGMNTSDRVMAKLSDEVRKIADRGIRSARAVERKTVLDRDFDPGGADH